MESVIYYSLKKEITTSTQSVALNQVCNISGGDVSVLDGEYLEIEDSVKVITALELCDKLRMLFPEYLLINAGPSETTVRVIVKQRRSAWINLKTLFLCIAMFIGGAFAIVTFHEDVGMRAVHARIYRFFTGMELNDSLIIGIPYSIGIALGFVLLLGIFSSRKNRPTNLDLDIFAHDKARGEYLKQHHRGRDG